MVNITKFAVRRPITIVLCLITIAYFGVQSLLGTKLELTPEMEMPMLVIATVYAGASPEDVNDLKMCIRDREYDGFADSYLCF